MENKTITKDEVSKAFMKHYWNDLKMIHEDYHEENFLVTGDFYAVGTLQIAYINGKWFYYMSTSNFGDDMLITLSKELGIQPEKTTQLMTEETFTNE